MEQPGRQTKFIRTTFNKVFKNMCLTDEILEELYEDTKNPLSNLMNALKELNTKEGQKVFIILKYTEEREPANYLANLMRKHHQGDIAVDLEKFNKSEQFIAYVNTEFLPVRQTDVLRSGGSCRFEMDSSPRGFCLILLNEMKLEAEAKQLASVFSQMFFTVKVIQKKNCNKINKLFDEVANDPKYQGFQSLVTIVIGHGSDGHLYGHRDFEDKVPIPHLIDKFSEDKCVNFKDKPKVIVLNCCRHRTGDKQLDLAEEGSLLLDKITCFKKNWVNSNTNTTVIYSTGEGQRSFFSEVNGMSYFGRAMSHTLAQFACEQNLDQLIKTICKRLEEDEVLQYPEVIHFKNKWALYFNPGRIKIS